MERVEAADYHDIVQLQEPRVAPDGERVAFVRKDPDDDEGYEETVYVTSTGGGEPRRFTIAEGTDSQPRWSPSGDRIAFVSTRGADDDRPQLWVLPTDGGEARQVTNVAGGVSQITWRPDGSRIAFVQQVTEDDREADRDLDVPEDFEPEAPDPRVVDRTVWRSMQRWFDGKRGQVYTVDLTEDDDIERVTTEEYDHASPEWGDDATLYYTVSRDEPDPDDSYEYDIVAYDTESGEHEEVHTATGWGTTLSATEDGRVAYMYTEPEQASLKPTELQVVEADSGDVHEPMAGLDRTLGYEAAPQWGPDDDLLYFTTPDEGASALWRVRWDEQDPERVVREDWSSIHAAHVGEDVVAFVRSEWDHPGDLFVATPAGAEEQRLTRINDDYLDERAVSQPEELEFESEGPRPSEASVDAASSEDGVELQGWVLTPPDFDPDEQYPLAVEVHGGPHAMWTTSGTMWHEFQTLAARGYVVFWSNPRGSSGYGEEFMSAIERDWGDVTMTDVMAGVEAVAARDYVDEDDAFLTGGSFGGYMTSWMVGHTDFFEGAVTQRGVHDLIGFYGSTDGAYKLVEGDFDAEPGEEPMFLWEQSPTAHAHEVDTPTLVVHSDDDYRTPANTADLFYRLLRKHGVDTRMVRYPEEGHELSRSGQPGHVVDRIERIVRWFDGYSDYQDVPPALERDDEEGLTAGEDDEDDEGVESDEE